MPGIQHNLSVSPIAHPPPPQAWGGSVLSSGSRDRCILHRDIRCAEHYTAKLLGHRSEVCGLKVRGRQRVGGGGDRRTADARD